MMKASTLWVCLAVFSGAVCAEQSDPCAGLQGSAFNQCSINQQSLRQQQIERQIQLQQERQNQLDNQQREIQKQLESMRLQNESLRKQLELAATSQPARPVAADYSKSADVKRWKADNPWFGSDYVKTQFAMRYIKQLQQERPDLAGRELLDALSMKVNEQFGVQR